MLSQILLFVLVSLLLDAQMTQDVDAQIISLCLMLANVGLVVVVFVDTRTEKHIRDRVLTARATPVQPGSSWIDGGGGGVVFENPLHSFDGAGAAEVETGGGSQIEMKQVRSFRTRLRDAQAVAAPAEASAELETEAEEEEEEEHNDGRDDGRLDVGDGWSEYREQNGRAYYHNHDTNTTTYEKPDAAKTHEERAGLPPCRWEEVATRDGRVYYSDGVRSVWEEPAELAAHKAKMKEIERGGPSEWEGGALEGEGKWGGERGAGGEEELGALPIEAAAPATPPAVHTGVDTPAVHPSRGPGRGLSGALGEGPFYGQV